MDMRLKAIAGQIEDGKGFIDVGTDHGYLPVALALSGYGGNIIASDIKSLPLNTARESAAAAGVSERIEFLLCDGLRLCDPDKIDTIVIAGMGGDMICHILDEAEWCMDEGYRLILQPMTHAEVLRYWLVNNGFELLRECMAEDAGTIYQIIVARFGKTMKLRDSELFTGSFELAQSRELYMSYLGDEIIRFTKALDGLESAAQKNSGRIKLYGSILHELVKARQGYDAGK